MKLKPYTYKPGEDGGALRTVFSLENVGEANYAEKVNWRRVELDQEGLREGDRLFYPKTSVAVGAQPLNATAPITLIAEGVRPNGAKALVVGTATTLYRFNHATASWDTIGSGFSGSAKRWQLDDLNGYLILNNGVDLPMTFRVEDAAVKPIYELREQGIAAVGWIFVFNGFLVCCDITEIQAAALAGVMNGATPYGPVASNIVNRIRYRVIWSEPAEPRRWAVAFHATMTVAGFEADLDFEPHPDTLAVGTKIAVVGAYLNGGTLGGQPPNVDGLPVVDVTGVTVEWSGLASDGALTYPLAVTIMRFSDLSTLSGGQDLQDDSSGILAAGVLGRVAYIYRETGIFQMRYNGTVDRPFVFSRVDIPPQARDRMLAHAYTLCNPTGDYHLFAGKSEFYTFDGLGEPRPLPVLNACRNLYFAHAGTGGFALRNPTTREIWFCTGHGTLALDYRWGSASYVDQVYTAGAFVQRPEGAEEWMVLAAKVGDTPDTWAVLQYGLLEADGQAITFRRRGAAYECRLTSGLLTLEDEMNEKDVRAYFVQLATRSDNVTVTSRLLGTDDPAKAPTQLFSVTQPTAKGRSLITALYRQGFFQDQVIVDTGQELTVGARLSGRTLLAANVRTLGWQRISE